jgi:hypothetical protein
MHYPCVLMITAWPDSARGLVMLKEKMIITTLSNGTTRLLVDLVQLPHLRLKTRIYS